MNAQVASTPFNEPGRVMGAGPGYRRQTPAYTFPDNFIWGVATAAAQIEGAATADGKGPSIWDVFAQHEGRIHHGDQLEPACDHYHRFAEDFALMRSLGIRHHRLSLSWPRLFPAGHGRPNPAGFAHYRSVFAAMREAGITPWVTLYHWDLPQALEEEGGWLNRRTVDAFRAYADAAVAEFAGEVQHWFTLNEINCFIHLGYGTGGHAPGRQTDPRTLKQAYHHALLAHGNAVAAVRRHGGASAKVGLAHNVDVSVPLSETEEDIVAAQTEFAYRHAHVFAPLFAGAYPPEYLGRHGTGPSVAPGDLELIAQPTDFLGLNVYSGFFVRQTSGDKPEMRAYAPGRRPLNPEVISLPDDFPSSKFATVKHFPQSLYWAIRHVRSLYSVPELVISENGVNAADSIDDRGRCLDLSRREYLRNYLIALHRSLEEGHPVRGYFLWSFLDNFEWAEGYNQRFGLVHVDYATQRRTPKYSARWYSEVIAQNRVL